MGLDLRSWMSAVHRWEHTEEGSDQTADCTSRSVLEMGCINGTGHMGPERPVSGLWPVCFVSQRQRVMNQFPQMFVQYTAKYTHKKAWECVFERTQANEPFSLPLVQKNPLNDQTLSPLDVIQSSLQMSQICPHHSRGYGLREQFRGRGFFISGTTPTSRNEIWK